MSMMPVEIIVNGRHYPCPKIPVVVICLDGCEPAYLAAAATAGMTPTLANIIRRGTERLAHGAMPSFTNPNNLSIATGAPPVVHGICGNYLFDPQTSQEVMMNDPRFLRSPTIFKAFHDAGARVAVVTAKDKLRALLGHGLSYETGRAICFSSERADTTTRHVNGIDNAAAWLSRAVPNVYSAELSEFVFAAGVKLLEEFRPDVMYLTTTDFVQHKFSPEEPNAIAFYAMFDRYLADLDRLGAAIVITADHGMKPKHYSDGSPAVIYIQDLLDAWLGVEVARVILPITDPYVVHHGSLGSFATVYLPQRTDRASVIEKLEGIAGIELVLDREAAAARFELPHDRIGDIVIVSSEGMTVGTSAHRHDLLALDAPLRSHGGLSEQTVPFIVNRPVAGLPSSPELRNFDAFAVACRSAADVAGPLTSDAYVSEAAPGMA